MARNRYNSAALRHDNVAGAFPHYCKPYTESTTRAYDRIIKDFAFYFHRSPDQFGPEHVREYTAHLFRDKKLSPNTVNQTVGALRFFFVKFLRRPWSAEDLPCPKKRIHLPVIWSRDEICRLIESAESPFHRKILTLNIATVIIHLSFHRSLSFVR